MKFITISVLLAFVLCCKASDNCHWGPSYWCKSESTAEECKATPYCKENVWKVSLEAKTPEVGSLKCDICEEVVKFAEQELLDNATEAEVKADLEELCDDFGPLKDTCTSLVDEYFDEIWQELIANGPDEVCDAVGLCTSHIQKLMKVKSVSCSMCKTVAKLVLHMVDNNSTEIEVKGEVKKMCPYLGGFSSECSMLVDTYWNELWKTALSDIEQNEEVLCKIIKLCPSTSGKISKRKTHVQQPHVQQPICDLCKLVTTFLKPYVDSNATEEEVKNALETACSLLPGNYSSDCTSLVDAYFDTIWTLLKQEIDSGEICTVLGLCGSTKNHLPLVKSVSRPQMKMGVCEVCKLVVETLRTFVDSNSTEGEAKAEVEKVCDKASFLKAECKELIDQYFPMIWRLMESYVDDDLICEEIKLCNDTTRLAKIESADTKVKGGVFCMVCELVMKEVTSLLDDNTTKQEIEDALDKVCGLLPSSVGTDCTEFVDKYGSEIIDLILSGTAARVVCTALGLCVLKEQMVQVQGSTECSVCETVLELAKSLIGSKTSQKSVEKVLDEVCVLTRGLEKECQMFVDTFGPELIELLVKEIDPHTICADIKVCVKEAESVLMKPWLKNAPKF